VFKNEKKQYFYYYKSKPFLEHERRRKKNLQHPHRLPQNGKFAYCFLAF
jgi:hypothetical protein